MIAAAPTWLRLFMSGLQLSHQFFMPKRGCSPCRKASTHGVNMRQIGCLRAEDVHESFHLTLTLNLTLILTQDGQAGGGGGSGFISGI